MLGILKSSEQKQTDRCHTYERCNDYEVNSAGRYCISRPNGKTNEIPFGIHHPAIFNFLLSTKAANPINENFEVSKESTSRKFMWSKTSKTLLRWIVILVSVLEVSTFFLFFYGLPSRRRNFCCWRISCVCLKRWNRAGLCAQSGFCAGSVKSEGWKMKEKIRRKKKNEETKNEIENQI